MTDVPGLTRSTCPASTGSIQPPDLDSRLDSVALSSRGPCRAPSGGTGMPHPGTPWLHHPGYTPPGYPATRTAGLLTAAGTNWSWGSISNLALAPRSVTSVWSRLSGFWLQTQPFTTDYNDPCKSYGSLDLSNPFGTPSILETLL